MNKEFEKIIEKLEEEKSNVPVNRLLDDIIKDKPKELGQLIAYNKAIEIVKQEAEQYNNGWIPCSSGVLPKRSNSYCVTKMCENDENPIYETCHEIFWTIDNKWDCERDEDCEWRVIAWKEKDKPYQPKGE